LVHRSIKAVLKRRKYHEDDWDALGVHCSRLERRADDASREVQSWLKCHYAAEHLGDEFDGTISGVAGFGIFVTVEPLMIDGMVHISELGRDYFTYDEVHHVLRGERSGREFRFGQRVHVKIVRADADSLKIDLALLDAPATEKPVFAPSVDIATHAQDDLVPLPVSKSVPVSVQPKPARPAPVARVPAEATAAAAPKAVKKPAKAAQQAKAQQASPKAPAKASVKAPAKVAKKAAAKTPAKAPAKQSPKPAKTAGKATKKSAAAKVAVKSAPAKKAARKKGAAKTAARKV
jgi:ribonuclease R